MLLNSVGSRLVKHEHPVEISGNHRIGERTEPDSGDFFPHFVNPPRRREQRQAGDHLMAVAGERAKNGCRIGGIPWFPDDPALVENDGIRSQRERIGMTCGNCGGFALGVPQRDAARISRRRNLRHTGGLRLEIKPESCEQLPAPGGLRG